VPARTDHAHDGEPAATGPLHEPDAEERAHAVDGVGDAHEPDGQLHREAGQLQDRRAVVTVEGTQRAIIGTSYTYYIH